MSEGQDFKPQELAAKIKAGQPLNPQEREAASVLVRFSEAGEKMVDAARYYGGVVTYATYKEGESEEMGATPLHFILACENPDPRTWQDVQAALGQGEQEEFPEGDEERAAVRAAITKMHKLGMLPKYTTFDESAEYYANMRQVLRAIRPLMADWEMAEKYRAAGAALINSELLSQAVALLAKAKEADTSPALGDELLKMRLQVQHTALGQTPEGEQLCSELYEQSRRHQMLTGKPEYYD